MAVRYSASGQTHSVTVSLGSQSNYSFAVWTRIVTDTNNYSTPWSFDNNADGTAFMLQTDVDGTSWTVWDDIAAAKIADGPVGAVGTDIFFGLMVAGTVGTLIWRTPSTGFSTDTWTGAARTITRVLLGNNRYSEFLNGRNAAFKFWTAGLSQAEMERESTQYVPVRTANVRMFCPFVRTETAEYSGNGHTLSGGTSSTTEDGPPIPWQVIRPRLILPAAAGGQTVVLGQATETDTVQPIARSKTRTLGQATETDTGQSVTRVKAKLVGQPSETDSAQPLARLKARVAGQVTETDTAQPADRVKARVLGQPSEADTAQAASRSKAKTLGQLSETDTAQPVSRLKLRILGQLVETDTAQPITASGATVLGQVTETDAAQGLARVKAKVLGQPTETTTAQPLGRAKARLLGQATETDTSGALVRLHIITINQAVETDLAQALGRAKARVLGQVTETDLALALAFVGAISRGSMSPVQRSAPGMAHTDRQSPTSTPAARTGPTMQGV